METVYEKEGDVLKITTPVVETVSIEELLAEKIAIESDKAAQEFQFAANMHTLSERLSRVNTLLTKAEEVGVELPPSEPSNEPVEDGS